MQSKNAGKVTGCPYRCLRSHVTCISGTSWGEQRWLYPFCLPTMSQRLGHGHELPCASKPVLARTLSTSEKGIAQEVGGMGLSGMLSGGPLCEAGWCLWRANPLSGSRSETTKHEASAVECLKNVWKYLSGQIHSGFLAPSTCPCNSDLYEGAFSLQPGFKAWLCSQLVL